MVYFSYSHVFKKEIDDRSSSRFSSTAIARGRLKDNKILNLEVLFIAKPNLFLESILAQEWLLKTSFFCKFW